VTDEERAFFDACVHEGMQSDGYAIEAALRGFRRWREQDPQRTLIEELKAADRDHLSAKNGMEKRLTAEIDRLRAALAGHQ
jgi:hypothetical protein